LKAFRSFRAFSRLVGCALLSVEIELEITDDRLIVLVGASIHWHRRAAGAAGAPGAPGAARTSSFVAAPKRRNRERHAKHHHQVTSHPKPPHMR
jgi:hypothetical protein